MHRHGDVALTPRLRAAEPLRVKVLVRRIASIPAQSLGPCLSPTHTCAPVPPSVVGPARELGSDRRR